MSYWLMKSEPEAFSIDNLAKCPNQTQAWDGVRNYQARNMMRDQMREGDLVFFYHSNANPSGIAGVAEVVSKPYPDATQFDSSSKYFDAKAMPDKPIWYLVDIRFKKKFDQLIALNELRENPLLKDMMVLRKGSRLSITPVTTKEWQAVLKMRG